MDYPNSDTVAEILVSSSKSRKKAIEVSFPISEISHLAKRESFRKEIFRPIYHIHKWWANRLGSVFRAIVSGCLSDESINIWEAFYNRHDFRDKVVLDPFMGSGTTLGETVKLGAKAIGCDVNPISTFAVSQALTRVDLDNLESAYQQLELEVQPEIARYYKTIDPDTGETIRVLYYFWVKEVDTLNGETIPLFKSYVFSKNAYPSRKPNAQIICPTCWRINQARYDIKELTCTWCENKFNPQVGPAKGQYIVDGSGEKHKIKDLMPKDGSPPSHRLYAMMALRSNDDKIYLTPQDYDLNLFEDARTRLNHEDLPLPSMSVRQGHNTNQARSYNYTKWRDFFNERQLLCLGLLLRHILEIEEADIKDQLLCLFSSTLEFNNLFCSFKGEGTGAVRHMFSHHTLKPERTPLENSVWGTNKSSGTFYSLFKSRLLKAKIYLDEPTEIHLQRDMFGNSSNFKSNYIQASKPIDVVITDSWDEFSAEQNRTLILNGDSSKLPIPDKSVDAIVTDPPYFDFIHYSELSDFFFAWLAPVLSDRYPFFRRLNSFHEGEVQNKDSKKFAASLSKVFLECHRVLKDDGLLTFSFHHSRLEGWAAIYEALKAASLFVVTAYPVHAEMGVASPKSSAKEPISLDMLLVCKKTLSQDVNDHFSETDNEQMESLRSAGTSISKTDVFNYKASQYLIYASQQDLSVEEFATLMSKEAII